VNGIKDKVLSLRDDFKYSVNTFGDQIERVKTQIAIENRTREKEDVDRSSAWINIILNVLLVAVLAYAAYVLVRKVFFPRRFVAPAVSVYTRPAYTA
jgi:undecaprenyl pyrophosphate phosphatase UppP